MNKHLIRIAIASVVVIVAVMFTLRNVDLGQMWLIVKSSNILLLLASIPLVLLSHVVRARRWQTLLYPAYGNVPFYPAFNAVMIGYATNTVIPRFGEVVRPWVFSRRTSVHMGAAFSSIIVERVIDVASLLVGILTVMILSPSTLTAAIPGITTTDVLLRIGLPLLLLLGGIGFLVATPMGERIVSRILESRKPRLSKKIVTILSTVRSGLKALATPKLYARLVIETALIWALYVLPLAVVAYSMPFAGAQNLDLAQISILLVIIAVAVTIAPTPGAIGVYQSFAQAGLVVLAGCSATEGLAFGIVSWVVNYGLALVVGGACWIFEARRGLSFSEVSKQ